VVPNAGRAGKVTLAANPRTGRVLRIHLPVVIRNYNRKHMATELVLVRHGHAVRVNGDYVHAPLTELGRTQADLTGVRFCSEMSKLDGYYASPLRRTKETSAIIGSKIGQVPGLKPGVQELAGLEVPTLVLMEVLARLGWFGHYLYENAGKPMHWPITGRVSTVVTDVVKKHEGGRVAIVTHSGVISSILAWYFPNKRRRWWRYVVDNCSLTRLRIEGTRAELLVVNDTNHLSDLLTTKQPPAATVQVANQAEQKIEQVVTSTGQKVDQAAAKTQDKVEQVAAAAGKTVDQVTAKAQDKAEQVATEVEEKATRGVTDSKPDK
jgi:2,3-bisphosphoglycerate-dependent phosphoglycerate mutase